MQLLSYLSVTDVDSSYKSAQAAGAKSLTAPVADTDATVAVANALGANIVVPPTDIAHVGRLAIFIDPQGATLAVMKPDPSMS